MICVTTFYKVGIRKKIGGNNAYCEAPIPF